MNFSIEFLPIAEDELLEAARRYRDVRPSLGDRFLLSVSDYKQVICTQPTRFPIEEGDIRRAIMSDFPYSIFYRVVRSRIFITAVYHHSRDPEGWKNRK